MATHLQLILENPGKFFWSIWHCLVYLFLVFIERILLPNACRAVSLRTQIARAVLGSFLANFWDLLFKAPWDLRDDEYLQLNAGEVPAILVPPKRSLEGIGSKEGSKKKLLLLYSHGGGYFFGEPLMYMSTYKRWIKAAAKKNIELTIVSVDYRLSNTHKYPACLEDMMKWYETLLDQYNVLPEQIVFGGDSAGGGLAAMTALNIKKLHKPSPAGMLLVSPWLDLEMKDTLHHPGMSTDFLITFTKDNPALVDALLPSGMRPEDPRVSPVFDDLQNLPPQFVITGGAEVLLADSNKWVQRSKAAGNKVDYVVGQGQMHTYAMGWPICSISDEEVADKQVASFLRGLVT